MTMSSGKRRLFDMFKTLKCQFAFLYGTFQLIWFVRSKTYATYLRYDTLHTHCNNKYLSNFYKLKKCFFCTRTHTASEQVSLFPLIVAILFESALFQVHYWGKKRHRHAQKFMIIRWDFFGTLQTYECMYSCAPNNKWESQRTENDTKQIGSVQMLTSHQNATNHIIKMQR